MSKGRKILICYDEPSGRYDNYTGKEISEESPYNDSSETEFQNNLDIITDALKNYYDNIEYLAFNRNIQDSIRIISDFKPDMLFNFVESVNGIASQESYAAGVFELIGVPYTGNTPLTLGICLDKMRTKQLLRSCNINTPKAQITGYRHTLKREAFHLKFPVICKLAAEDASIGISEFSVVNDFNALHERLGYLFGIYKKDVLIEEYIEGREFNVAVLDSLALPVSEILFEGLPENLPRIVTYEGKWAQQSIYYKNTVPNCPAQLDKAKENEIKSLATETFKVMGCRDYARVDFRMNSQGELFVIEVNPNPDISSDAGFARAAAAVGIDYPALLYKISQFAIKRKNDKTSNYGRQN